MEIGKAVAGNSERQAEGACACVPCPVVCGPYEHVFATFRFVGANLSSRSPIHTVHRTQGRIRHTGHAYIHTPTYVLGWISRGQPRPDIGRRRDPKSV